MGSASAKNMLTVSGEIAANSRFLLTFRHCMSIIVLSNYTKTFAYLYKKINGESK